MHIRSYLLGDPDCQALASVLDTHGGPVLTWPSTRRLDPLHNNHSTYSRCMSDIITYLGFIVRVKFPSSVQKVTLESQISVIVSVSYKNKTPYT